MSRTHCPNCGDAAKEMRRNESAKFFACPSCDNSFSVASNRGCKLMTFIFDVDQETGIGVRKYIPARGGVFKWSEAKAIRDQDRSIRIVNL